MGIGILKMNRLLSMRLLTCLFLVLCVGTFLSCTDKDNLSEEETLKKDLLGQWYSSEDNQIYSVLFAKNGTGTITYYTYSDKQWEKQIITLQYTLLDHTLTIKSSEGDTLIGTIGMVGNSMSLSNEDFTMMFTRYDGNEEKINELKKEIEDNWLDLEPGDSVNEDNFWITESNVQAAVFGIYAGLRDYEYKQLLLEKIRLTQKDFNEQPANGINPNSREIADTWNAAYNVINRANIVIENLNSKEITGLNENKRIAYINEAKVLRSIVFYNISQLWGKVPYITTYNPNDYNEILNSPILSSIELCSKLNEDLQDIDILLEGDGRITKETVNALRGEIALYMGNKKEAEYLLQDCQSDFYIQIDRESTPLMYQLFGEKLSNYTPKKVELLFKEIHTVTEDEKQYLLTEWKDSQLYWGYWIMLKRTEQAQKLSGCEEHELLMPIPQGKLDLMPSLVQNPGY